MSADIVSIEDHEAYHQAIVRAVEVLDEGGLVIFPTETVYGVAARADRPQGVDRLRRIKGRSADRPFTVHIGRREDVDRYVPRMSPVARRLVRKGWPGPLTLVFPVGDPGAAPIAPGADEVTMNALYHEGTIGVRCPEGWTAAELLSRIDGPVVAASANAAGQAPPTSVGAVAPPMREAVDLVLDGGPSRYAKASTLVRLNGDGFTIVRPGVNDERTLRKLAAQNFLFVCTGNTCRSPMAATLWSHLVSGKLGCKVEELESRGVRVSSAGTFAGRGVPPTAEAVEAMARRGLRLCGPGSQALSAPLIHRADHIFVMTSSHLHTVLDLVPSAKDRTRRVSDDADIEDPVGGPVDVYVKCAQALESALQQRLPEVKI